MPGLIAKLPGADRAAAIRKAAEQIQVMLQYHFPTDPYDLVGRGMGFRGASRCDFTLFSEGLHALQDSFSHGGGNPSFGPLGGHPTGVLTVPDIIGTLSNIFQGNFKIETAQVQLRGLLAGLSHSADDPRVRQPQFEKMAMETFNRMSQFAKLCGKCACPESKGAVSPNGPVQHTDSNFNTWLKNWYQAKYNKELK